MSMTKLLGVLSLAVSLAACLGGSKEEDDGASPFVPPPPNGAPVIGSLPVESTVIAGSALSIQPTASDPDNDPLTFEISNRPGWSTFDTATGRLWGTPTAVQVGTYSNIRISVRDSTHMTSGNAFRIVVNAVTTPPPPSNQPPVISGTPLTAVTTGQAYSFTPSASDPEGQALTFSISSKPTWATFSTSNGRLSGTPGNGTGGTYSNIRISVSDGTSTVSLAAFSITVIQANRAPTISGTPATTGREGIAYTFTPTGSDPDGQVLTYSVSGKPAWAAFTTSTGRLSGTPPAGSAGSFPSIVITASDGSLQSSLSAFSITVAANRAPTISGTPATTATVGQAYSFTPTASDADGNALSYTIANKPAWATFTASSGRLSGTPTAANVGSHAAIRISVTDTMATTSLPDFAIEVVEGNQAPVISGTPPTTGREGIAYTFTPTGSDPDGQTLTYSVSGKPAWAAFNTSTGRLSGTPPAGSAGSFPSIVITASDGSLQTSLPAFSITVAANRAPTISGTPPASVTVGQAYSFTPTASDADGNTLSYTIANKPAWATFAASSGSLSGTPTAANVGNHAAIRISVTDTMATTSLPDFAIEVVAGNQAPVISGTPPTAVTTGQAYSFQPTASDPDGDTLTFSIVNKPAWASFNTGTGGLSGTPVTADVGSYANIQIRVSDGTLLSSLAAFTITVTQANRAPNISGTPPTTGREGIGYTFTPTGSDPDGQTLTYSVSGKPAWAAFTTSTGRLSGTPPAGSAGSFPGIVITASDGSLQTSLPAFSITVAANRAPTISGTPAASVTVGQAYSFTPTASDADGNAISFTIANKPVWASFTASSGRLSGTPTATHVGVHTAIRISVTDTMATTSLPDFEITVVAVNLPPVISGTPATSVLAGQAYSFQPTASDPDSNTLAFSIVNKPAWATFNTGTGRLSGTPAAADVGPHANIQIRVSDGTLLTSLPAFTITVQQTANGSATLSWMAPTTRTDGSALTNLAGYKLRYGNSAGNYPNTVTINNAGVTNFMIENLASGTWFFVVAAFDANGLESTNTNPVSKTIQ